MEKTGYTESMSTIAEQIKQMLDLLEKFAAHSARCYNALSPKGDTSVDLLAFHRDHRAYIKDLNSSEENLKMLPQDPAIQDLLAQAKEVLGELLAIEGILQDKAPIPPSPRP